MSDIETAERIVGELKAKRDVLVARGIELGEQRLALAFAAHTGDDKARKQLDAVNREDAVRDSELRSLDAAIAEATKRVAVAVAAEAVEKDRAAALKLRKTVHEIGEALKYADAHFSKAVEALNVVHGALDQLHAGGSEFPTHMQMAANAERALKTMLMALPRHWTRDFSEHLAPSERRTFQSFWAQMETAIEQRIRLRLGEAECDKTKEHAA